MNIHKNHYTPCSFDEGLIHLDKLQQTYMLAALNTREAQSKQTKQRYDDVPNYKIGDLLMIKNFDRKSTWDTKYVANFRVLNLIGSKQLEVSDPTHRSRKVNICDAHKIMPLDHIISSIPDEQVFSQRGKYINDPRITEEVVIIDAFLHEKFPKVRVRLK